MRKVTVSEAARILGITPDGVRMRVRRNSIEHERDENGRLFVYVDESEPLRNEVTDASANAYIESLKSQIELLRDELESQRELLHRELEDWKEEARRKDTIIMSLTQRIPELESASTTDSSSDASDSPVTASEEESKGETPPESETASEPWWRRIFR